MFTIMFLAALYFLPTLVAVVKNKKRNLMALVLLNALLGWTFIGWVGALIWAALDEKN